MIAIHSQDAEESVIGAALLYHDECADAFERLKPEHFYEPVRSRLWARILTRRNKGSLPDILSIADAMGEDEAFSELGGRVYLADLVNGATAWALHAHVDAIIDRSVRREIQRLTQDVVSRAHDTGETTGEALLGELERGAADIARDASSRPLAVPAGLTALDMLESAWRGEFTGVSVGLNALDRVTGGIRQDDVWFIGARTSMGKSVCALSLARGIAQQGRGVMVFSLEMPLREVQARLIADLAYDPEARYDGAYGVQNVRYGDLLKGKGTDQQRDNARRAAKRLAGLPIAVTDVGGLTIDEIRAQAVRQMRAWERSGVQRGAIIVDHIGLVRPHTKRNDSKAAETADIVNELKGIAKQVRAPVIALCQVNRQTESRNDKRPTLADLNWSGAIEQIADLICLLYRESYYLERSADPNDQDRAATVNNELELLIHKNRSGPICNLKAFIDIACNAVRDIGEGRRAAV